MLHFQTIINKNNLTIYKHPTHLISIKLTLVSDSNVSLSIFIGKLVCLSKTTPVDQRKQFKWTQNESELRSNMSEVLRLSICHPTLLNSSSSCCGTLLKPILSITLLLFFAFLNFISSKLILFIFCVLIKIQIDIL